MTDRQNVAKIRLHRERIAIVWLQPVLARSDSGHIVVLRKSRKVLVELFHALFVGLESFLL